MAKHYEIIGRRPVDGFCTNRVEFFDLGPPREISSRQLLSGPGWDLFALDLEKHLAHFVKLDGRPEPYAAPFLYAELFERAAQLITLAFDEFFALAQDVPEPKNLVHVLSMGRCGSTVVHHLFNNAAGVLSLSEPDPFIALAMARFDLSDETAIELLRACSRLHFLAGVQRGDHTMVIKHHSQSLFQAKRLLAANPSAKFVFMYREAESWGDSVYRMTQSFGFPLVPERKDRELMWYILSAATDPKNLGEIIDIADETTQADRWIAVVWAIHVIEYLRLFEGRMKMLAINYADLNADPAASVARLFDYCALPAADPDLVLKIFEQDSQAGTRLARGRKVIGFTPDNFANFRETLSKFSEITSPEMILPSL